MKRFIFLMLTLFTGFSFVYAGDVVTFDTKRLPDAARTFIEHHFPTAQISHIKIEEDFLRTKKYEVLLTDRTELEFDGKGNWIEIECDNVPVPSTLIPAYVSTYLKSKFPDNLVVKIERKLKKQEIEIELDNDLSLTFNVRGELIDIDD